MSNIDDAIGQPGTWPIGRHSDIGLGVASLLAAAISASQMPIAQLGSLEQVSAWAFPAAISVLLGSVGLVLLARGIMSIELTRRALTLPQLGLAIVTVGGLLLVLPLGGLRLALNFGPTEFVALRVLELTLLIAFCVLSRLRAVAMAVLGLLLAAIGTDLSTGSERLTFGLASLGDGIPRLLAVLGLLVVADGLLCLFSPSLLLGTYARLIDGWSVPRLTDALEIAARAVAALVLAFAGLAAVQLNNSPWDVGLLALFGAFGLACKYFGWNRLVFLAAAAEGPILEENIKRALMISRGDPWTFVHRPISGSLLLAACTIAIVAAVLAIRGRHARSMPPTAAPS